MATIYGKRKFFAKSRWLLCRLQIPRGSKISSKSLYLAWFSRYKHFVFCNYCEKFENSKQPPFWKRLKFFCKNVLVNLQRYPVGQKFCRNHSILHGFQDVTTFVFCNFCKKFKSSKWLQFWVRQKFFENVLICRDPLRGKNFDKITLSCTVFEI